MCRGAYLQGGVEAQGRLVEGEGPRREDLIMSTSELQHQFLMNDYQLQYRKTSV